MFRRFLFHALPNSQLPFNVVRWLHAIRRRERSHPALLRHGTRRERNRYGLLQHGMRREKSRHELLLHGRYRRCGQRLLPLAQVHDWLHKHVHRRFHARRRTFLLPHR